jgi:ubiquinone/menaquinone biosynthesis C-methylase UbiE
MYQGRIKHIIRLFKKLNLQFHKVLEVGGGFGLFSLNYKYNFPNTDVHILDKTSREISEIADKI